MSPYVGWNVAATRNNRWKELRALPWPDGARSGIALTFKAPMNGAAREVEAARVRGVLTRAGQVVVDIVWASPQALMAWVESVDPALVARSVEAWPDKTLFCTLIRDEHGNPVTGGTP